MLKGHELWTLHNFCLQCPFNLDNTKDETILVSQYTGSIRSRHYTNIYSKKQEETNKQWNMKVETQNIIKRKPAEDDMLILSSEISYATA